MTEPKKLRNRLGIWGWEIFSTPTFETHFKMAQNGAIVAIQNKNPQTLICRGVRGQVLRHLGSDRTIPYPPPPPLNSQNTQSKHEIDRDDQ